MSSRTVNYLVFGIGVGLLLIATSFFCMGAGHGIFFPIAISSGPFSILAPLSEPGQAMALFGPIILWPVLFYLASLSSRPALKVIFRILYASSFVIGATVAVWGEIVFESFPSRFHGVVQAIPLALPIWLAAYFSAMIWVRYLWRRNSGVS